MKSNNLNGLFSYHFSSNGIGYKIFNKSNYAKYVIYNANFGKTSEGINKSKYISFVLISLIIFYSSFSQKITFKSKKREEKETTFQIISIDVKSNQIISDKKIVEKLVKENILGS